MLIILLMFAIEFTKFIIYYFRIIQRFPLSQSEVIKVLFDLIQYVILSF